MTIFLASQTENEQLVIHDPKQLSQGYRRSLQLRPGIQLLIQEYDLHDHLVLVNQRLSLAANLEFVFNLMGKRCHDWENSGQSCICSCPHPQTQPQEFIQEWKSQQQVRKVDIHIENQILCHYFQDQLDSLPPTLRQSLEAPETDFSPYLDGITPAMQVILEGILNCPYQGVTQTLYLESRVLELIALQLDRVVTNTSEPTSVVLRKSEDIDRIHYAKDTLFSNLDHPPSLSELARLVGLNEYKLKLGFHEVFGTTPFGYLRDRRLEKAQQLLREGNMKIEAIAHTVGYANRSRFAHAFRKKYGVNPSRYKQQNAS